jgi:hypothetical protein
MSNKHHTPSNTVQPQATADNTALLAELETLRAKLAASEAETARLREERQPGTITLGIGPKGGIIIRGLSRMGISLYGSQARRLFEPETVKRILDYVDANVDHLAWKVNGVNMPPAKPLPNYGKPYVAGAGKSDAGEQTIADNATTRAAATMAARDEADRQAEFARTQEAAQAGTV